MVGLIGYAVKGLSIGGLKLSPELAMAVSIWWLRPLVWLGMRGLRRRVALEEN